ncbi:MAG: DNA primase [Alphaproteobacteria bacterium]|nr:DNA primase [Alphaproteobacteria bacterium]
MFGNTNNFNDELRARLSIVDVIGQHVPLIKKGKDFWGCCPFHGEKTPSFKVNEEMGRYYCFGCGEKGDIISFTMKTRNMQFPEAIRELANLAGLKVPEYKPKDAATIEREQSYFEIIEAATQLYQDRLFSPDGEFALNYIRKRGFSDENIKKFRIGYAPTGNVVANKFANQKISNLLATGLIRESDRGTAPYDFFRNKLMFPIFNPTGQIIAFSGRSLDGSEPKYINTGETEFFKKRQTVFGLNFARNEIHKANRSIVVEGQIDAIQMQTHGFGETVAPLGTALSEEHLQILCKLNRNITFCFDGDKAGQKAAARAISLVMPLLRPESDMRFAFVTGGKDPDDILRSGADGAKQLRQIINSAIPIEQFLWDWVCKNFIISTPQGQALAEKFYMAEIEKIPDFSLKNRFKTYFFNLRKESWKFTARMETIPVPNIDSIAHKTLSEIAATYPELIEKHSEFLVKIGAKFDGDQAVGNLTLTQSDAEKFIVSLKLGNYLDILQDEKKELTAKMLVTAESADQNDSARIAHIDSEIKKTMEKINLLAEI